MVRQTRISALADRIIEAGWLLALVFIPYFFNLQTARHFEPDKATVLRALVLVMLVAWLVKTLERVTVLGERPRWQGFWRAPLALPTLIYAGVFVLATIFSIDRNISWWGGYNRLQGTYTNLSYIVLFALIVGNLRTRAQLDRLITTMILTAVGVAAYGLLQHNDLDPLPWKGDTAFRIASTMGNSIFVGAYLIMIIPFVLYRLSSAIGHLPHATRRAGRSDFIWLGLALLALLAQQAMLLGQIKFGAAVRTADFRYWWVFPAALAVTTASFALVSTPRERRLGIVSGASVGIWTLLLLIFFAASAGVQQVSREPRLADWWLWTLLGVLGIGLFAVGALFVAPREVEGVSESRIWLLAQVVGYALVLGLLILAVFYSQSRGPQIGLLAGLFVFINLLLLRRWRAARQTGSMRARRWGTALGIATLIQMAGLVFLVLFNVSDAPVFTQLRQAPYVGRLGQLLETEGGTGRVRTLIWFGDEIGKGTLGLITANPVRAVIGYGPETMFTVYNPHYPPRLAQFEARGASPDRSHQAQLDELVTKGALGLVSFIFLFLSAGVLAWRLFWRSPSLEYQLLYLACFAAVVAHLFEGLTGIPIVSTLTLLWVTLGVLVVGGKLEGQLGTAPEEEAVPVPAPVAAPIPQPKARGTRGSRTGSTVRGAAPARGYVPAPQNRAGSFRWMYVPLVVLALVGVWFGNLRSVRADMYYNVAQSTGTTDVNTALSKYLSTLRAVQLAPNEDYYHLQLGNALIQLGYNFKIRSAQTNNDPALAQPRANQTFDDLFRGSSLEDAAITTFRNNSGFQLLEYARLVLERADQLSPTNKDHPANLGRLNALWYQLTGEQAKLDAALGWYEEAHRIAPNDVVILNEWATNLANTGPERSAEVEQKFLDSQRLDPRFLETYLRLGNFYRATNQLDKAGGQYVKVLELNQVAITDATQPTLAEVITLFKDQPAVLQKMVDTLRQAATAYPDDATLAALPDGQETTQRNNYAQAYSTMGRIAAAINDKPAVQTSFDRAIAITPNNAQTHLYYARALSDTIQYDAALSRARAGLEVAQREQRTAEAESLNQLISQIEQRKISGGR